MFKIADGREQFYQWDLDRQVIVEDPSVVEVHFCNRTDDCSLCVEVVDGLANVPNILLQRSFNIRVFGYDGKATLHEKTFKVIPRTQPADYIYTETVTKSVDEILVAAEQVGTIAKEFYDFVDEYKVGLVDDGQGNVELKAVEKEGGDVDLDNYYTKDEIDNLLDDIESGDVDLSEYAKKEDIPDVSKFITEVPSEYITETELSAKGYATGGYVDSKVAGIVIPTKVSAFENDKGYLTEHQSLEGYAKLSDIPTVPSLDGYATETYVTNAITTAFAGIANAEGGAY